VELESLESHRRLLEKKVNHGYDEAAHQLKAAQQQLVSSLIIIIIIVVMVVMVVMCLRTTQS